MPSLIVNVRANESMLRKFPLVKQVIAYIYNYKRNNQGEWAGCPNKI